jgi:hypothetical protein
MALASRLRQSISSVIADEPEPIAHIPPLADDPEHKRLTELLRELRAGLTVRRMQEELVVIDNVLRSGDIMPGHSQQAARSLARRETLLAALPKLRAVDSDAPLSPAAGVHPDVATAFRLLRGERLQARQDDPEARTRLAREILQFEAAIRAVDRQLDELREERSAEIARQLLPQHREILRSKMDALLAVAAAASAERQLLSEMIQAGYTLQPGIMMSPPCAPASLVGTPDNHDSAVATYRRALSMAGVLP